VGKEAGSDGNWNEELDENEQEHDFDDGLDIDEEDADWSPSELGEHDEYNSPGLFYDEEASGGSESSREKRKVIAAARVEMCNERQDDEALRRLKAILTTEPDRTYTLADLDNSATLKHAL
jgi:hypothetical protein